MISRNAFPPRPSGPTRLPREPEGWLPYISPQVHYLWRTRLPPGERSGLRLVNDHLLYLVLDGRITLDVGGTAARIGKGDWAIVPPGVWYESRVGPSPLRGYLVHFSWLPAKLPKGWCLSFIAPAKPRPEFVLSPPPFVPKGLLHGPLSAGHLPLVSALWRSWARELGREPLDARGPLLTLLTAIFRTVRNPGPSPAEHLVEQVEAALSDPELPDGSIRAVLSRTGYRYEHVARIYRRLRGMTPGQFLTHRRLERALALLQEPAWEIHDVAFRCGFHDPGYFARVFHRHYGMTPSRYRSGLRPSPP